MNDDKFRIDDGSTRVVLYYEDVLVRQFKKINRNAEIVLTNGSHHTTSATIFQKLRDYCLDEGYEVVTNETVDEYNGHVQ
mgnify:CR=1 FL=1